jgi:hypothetical protein
VEVEGDTFKKRHAKCTAVAHVERWVENGQPVDHPPGQKGRLK